MPRLYMHAQCTCLQLHMTADRQCRHNTQASVARVVNDISFWEVTAGRLAEVTCVRRAQFGPRQPDGRKLPPNKTGLPYLEC